VPAVADLAAGILFDADLPDAHRAVAEGHLAVGADDGGTLEAGGDAAVQVLLAGDVHFADDVAAQQHRHQQAAVQGQVVHLEGRGVVHLVGADRLAVQQVDDLLARLELHQRGAVVLAHLRERRAHVAQDLGVVVVAVVAAGGAAAEQLAHGQQLLVDLQPAAEAQGGVVVVRQCAPGRERLQEPGIGQAVLAGQGHGVHLVERAESGWTGSAPRASERSRGRPVNRLTRDYISNMVNRQTRNKPPGRFL